MWVLGEDTDTYPDYTDLSPYGNPPLPMPTTFTFPEGDWDVTVVMYTIDRPASQRTAWFRLVDENAINETTGKFNTFEANGWIFSSGVLGESSTTPSVTLTPTDFPDAPAQFMRIEGCLSALFQDATTWTSSCP